MIDWDKEFSVESVMGNPGPPCILFVKDQDGVQRPVLYSKSAERKVRAALRKSNGKTWFNGDGYPMIGMEFLHKIVKKGRKGFVIDHLDRNKLDCTEQNLKYVRPCENSRNTSGPKTNTGLTGITEITLKNGEKRYEVQINRKADRRSKRFKTLAEAEAYWLQREQSRLKADFEKYGYLPICRSFHTFVPVQCEYLGVNVEGLDPASIEQLKAEGHKIYSPELLKEGEA
jgi:hypothetical protein